MKNIFWLLLKKEAIDNRKTLLLGLLGILATFILSGVFLGSTKLNNLGIELFLFTFMGFLVLSIGASLTFSNMKTKEDRISTLMLPASALQKFMVRWTATVPALLIVLLVSIFLGDSTRMLACNISGRSARSLCYYLFCDSNIIDNDEWIIFLTIFSGFLSTQAIYFLGSILWPKLSFIKTLAVMQIIQLIFAILTFCITWKLDLNKLDLFLDGPGFLWAVIIYDVVFCGLLYWLAYLRFKKSQVVYKLF